MYSEKKKWNRWVIIILAIVALCGIDYVLDASPAWSKIINMVYK